MENFQNEILEIEFNEFSHGFKTISDLDFAEILLRYTDFDRETKKSIIKKVKKTAHQSTVRIFTESNIFQNFSSRLRLADLGRETLRLTSWFFIFDKFEFSWKHRTTISLKNISISSGKLVHRRRFRLIQPASLQKFQCSSCNSVDLLFLNRVENQYSNHR